MPAVPLHVFALTGGIGSGKSTVARRFRDRGLPVVDADALSREVVAEGTPALSEIAVEFGADVLTPEGTLDRARLAERVFAHPLARARLEAITHPRIRKLSTARFLALEQQGEPLACYEVPLLFEAGLDLTWRPVVVVTAPQEVCLQRAAARDGAPEEAILARMRAQIALEEKARRADFVIDNGGSLELTLGAADRVLELVAQQKGVPAERYPLPA